MILPVAHNICVPAVVGLHLPAAKDAGMVRRLQAQRTRDMISEGAHPGVVGGVHAQDSRYQERAERNCHSPHPEWMKNLP